MSEGRGQAEGERGEQEVETLRRENALLLALLESASELVDVVAPDGTLLRTFRARDRPLGYEPHELRGHNAAEIVHPDDLAAVRQVLSEVARGGRKSFTIELRLRRKDGEYLPMECVIEDRSHDPVVGGIVVCSRDISARLELERELRMAQRMESVGRVASGMVHDFNNLLAVIGLAAERAQSAVEAQDPLAARAAITDITSAAERGASLTKRLLSFVRDRPARPRPLDLTALVRGQEQAWRGVLAESIELRIVLDDAPAIVVADPAELEHALLNLVLNARDAMPQGGHLVVSVSVEADRTVLGSQRGGRAVVEVRDDGEGMDVETRRRAFEPFFTTKSAERGTGLGLWVVNEVVARCGGQIELSSRPKQGSTIGLHLPLAGSDRRPSPVPEVTPEGRALRILLVDDEPHLLDLMAQILEQQGHTVYRANDGVEALELAGRIDPAPDLLITDVSMPQLGGFALCARLRERWPGLPAIVVSGFGDTLDAPDDETTVQLAKPFDMSELTASIHRLIGG